MAYKVPIAIVVALICATQLYAKPTPDEAAPARPANRALLPSQHIHTETVEATPDRSESSTTTQLVQGMDDERPEHMDDNYCAGPFCTMDFNPICDSEGTLHANKCAYLIEKFCHNKPNLKRLPCTAAQLTAAGVPAFELPIYEANQSQPEESN